MRRFVRSRWAETGDRDAAFCAIAMGRYAHFDHAQGLSAQAEAKAGRAKVELAATEGRVDVEVATATANANKRLEAAEVFEAELGTSFEDNVRLAMKGYAAGETSLSEVLLVRRELVDTETSRVDRLLELRAAEIELLYTAGVLP